MSDTPDVNRAPGGTALNVVDYIVRELVDDPDSVSVEVVEDGNRVEFQVETAPDDVGRIIGRRGHVIQSIRTLARAAAAKEGLEADVEIID
ncbi:MAG TPA: KH domain-containing protein [Acidimicrobiales bacterium]|nr:KH domain-containing protein [Acidimicrobiales bacterium]